MIDLRSDTVTLPTEAMLRAIPGAPLGDDVYGEDPTVARLERHTAALLGKEAGLFVPSGTMGNLCALLTHGARGTRAIVGDESHIFRYEAGGASALGGLMLHPLTTTADGGLDLAALAVALESPDDPHLAPAALVALENTHNRGGGLPLSAAQIAAHADLAHAHGVPLHLDGARLFNAAVALGVSARSLVEPTDSVQVCFSKGLSAPAGSMLLGTASFIHRARRVRKMLGGGMRQVGVLAVACQVALDTMIDRLADDHRRAGALARGIADAIGTRPYAIDEPPTNLVVLRALGPGGSSPEMVSALRARGVLVGALDARRLRAVLHRGIDDAQVEQAIAAFAAVLAATPVSAP